jgi:hypothetical protein
VSALAVRARELRTWCPTPANASRWLALFIVVPVVIVHTAVLRALGGDHPSAYAQSAGFAAAAIAVVAGFAVDDEAAELTDAVPTPLWQRRVDQLVPHIAMITLCWLFLIGAARAAFPTGSATSSVGLLALASAATAAMSLELASVIARFGTAPPGVTAAGSVLALQYVSTAVGSHTAIGASQAQLWCALIAVAMAATATVSADVR